MSLKNQNLLNAQHPDIQHILRINTTREEINYDFIERYKKDNISKLTKDCEFVYIIKSFVGEWIEDQWKAVEYILGRQKELDGKSNKLESHKCLCGQCNLQNLCFIEHIPSGVIFKVGIDCITKISEQCYEDMLTLQKTRKMRLISNLIEKQYQEIIASVHRELDSLPLPLDFSKKFEILRDYNERAKNETFNSIPDKSNITIKKTYKEKLLKAVDTMFNKAFKDQEKYELKIKRDKLVEYISTELQAIDKNDSEENTLYKLTQLRRVIKEKFPLDPLLLTVDNARKQMVAYWDEFVEIDGYDTLYNKIIRQLIKDHHAKWSKETEKWSVQRRELQIVKKCCNVGEHLCTLRKTPNCKVCSKPNGDHPTLCDFCRFVPFPKDSEFYMEIDQLFKQSTNIQNQIISGAHFNIKNNTNGEAEKWKNFLRAHLSFSPPLENYA
jgi:hypothetical protein